MTIRVNSLYLADCLTLMERLEPNVIALTYVDVPWPDDTFSRNMRARDANHIRQHQDRELKEWLIFLYKVFQQIRRILLDRGTVFVHSTTQQNNRIRLILDQTMGSENFRGEFIWPIRSGARSHNAHAPQHDTIILYSKTNDFTYNAPLKPGTTDDLARFNHSDTRGRFMSVNLLSPVERPSLRYKWNGLVPPAGRSWRFTEAKMSELANDDMLHFSSGGYPQLKVYLEDNPMVPVGTIWDDISPRLTGSERGGSYPGQQPTALLNRIIGMGSNEGDTVLDLLQNKRGRPWRDPHMALYALKMVPITVQRPCYRACEERSRYSATSLLDPFCGTGTALVAADTLKRKWIGCDSSKEAWDIACQRLRSFGTLDSVPEFVAEDHEFLKGFPVVARVSGPTDTKIDIFTLTPTSRFVKDQKVQIEETRDYEFKEIRSPNERDILSDIKEDIDVYVVAFLNVNGGRIYWGISDDRVSKGVRLPDTLRDKVRKLVEQKIKDIKPFVSPSNYSLEFRPVLNSNEEAIEDLFVIEVVVPRSSTPTLYSTGSGDTWVKREGIKHKLGAQNILSYAEDRRRQYSSPSAID